MGERQKWPELSEEQHHALLDLYNAGHGTPEIERRTGINRFHALALLKRWEWARPHGKAEKARARWWRRLLESAD